jgi:hypothetical protein
MTGRQAFVAIKVSLLSEPMAEQRGVYAPTLTETSACVALCHFNSTIGYGTGIQMED